MEPSNHDNMNFEQSGLDLSIQDLPSADLPTQNQEQEDLQEPNLEDNPASDQEALAAMREKIERLIRMTNLADITLPGYMIKVLRHKAKLSFRELIGEVSKCYEVLRRSDGSKYTGDLAKAVKGCLTSTEVFKEVGENVWTIREREARIYEEKTTNKLKSLILQKEGKGAKKKGSDLDEGDESQGDISRSESDDPSSRNLDRSMPTKKVKISEFDNKLQKTINMLELYSKDIKQNDNTKSLVPISFQLVNNSCPSGDIMAKIGKERFSGIIECFDYFYPLIQDYIKRNLNGDFTGKSKTAIKSNVKGKKIAQIKSKMAKK